MDTKHSDHDSDTDLSSVQHRPRDLLPISVILDGITSLEEAERTIILADQLYPHDENHKADVRAYRNHLLPIIAKPPHEIYSQIFYYLTPPFPDEHETWYKKTDIAWISFSQVCRAWRKLALGNPLLWSQPNFEIPDMAMEMAKRARDIPLSIIISNDAPDIKNDHYRETIISVMRRGFNNVREFQATEMHPYLVLPKILHGMMHAPLLEIFQCTLIPQSRLTRRGTDTDDPVCIIAPRLKSIELLGAFCYPFPLQPFEKLTEIVLGQLERRVSLSALFELLKSAPLLGKAHFYQAIDSSAPEDVALPGPSLTQLLKLESLEVIDGDIPLITRVLSYLYLPNLSHLKIGDRVERLLQVPDVEALLAQIHETVSTCNSGPFYGMGAVGKVLLRGKCTIAFTTAVSNKNQKRLSVVLENMWMGSAILQYFDRFFPLRSIETLYAQSWMDWEPLAYFLPNISSVKLIETFGYRVVERFLLVLRPHVPFDDHSPAFPQLSSLIVENRHMKGIVLYEILGILKARVEADYMPLKLKSLVVSRPLNVPWIQDECIPQCERLVSDLCSHGVLFSYH